MPKAINIFDKKTGDFKGIEYVVKNGDGSSIILRNFSTSGVGDWTLQLSKIPNANPNMELKFTDVIK